MWHLVPKKGNVLWPVAVLVALGGVLVSSLLTSTQSVAEPPTGAAASSVLSCPPSVFVAGQERPSLIIMGHEDGPERYYPTPEEALPVFMADMLPSLRTFPARKVPIDGSRAQFRFSRPGQTAIIAVADIEKIEGMGWAGTSSIACDAVLVPGTSEGGRG